MFMHRPIGQQSLYSMDAKCKHDIRMESLSHLPNRNKERNSAEAVHLYDPSRICNDMLGPRKKKNYKFIIHSDDDGRLLFITLLLIVVLASRHHHRN